MEGSRVDDERVEEVDGKRKGWQDEGSETGVNHPAVAGGARWATKHSPAAVYSLTRNNTTTQPHRADNPLYRNTNRLTRVKTGCFISCLLLMAHFSSPRWMQALDFRVFLR